MLELLTENLITKKILVGDTTVKVKGGETKTVTWDKKLKYLLARKTETENKTFPKLSEGTLAAFAVAVLTPIFTFIAYAIRPDEPQWWFSIILILIAGLPVIVSLILWCRLYKKDTAKYGLSYLLAIYQDKIKNDITYETISESEPTVKEFKGWMTDISNAIGNEAKPKLIIVFDNMDRLPAEKVKELWSSIHTFFAEDGFDNVWAIIPFDQEHLACAFGDNDQKAKELTTYFISKTFPIVYHVSIPVITDYKEIINELLSEAFGDISGAEFSNINRMYRLLRPNANVRDIIVFINELVALEQQWPPAEISLASKAIYTLQRDTIHSNPVVQILSGNYMEKVVDVISNSEVIQEQVSSLVYGIEIEHAKQIPLTKYLNECISGNKELDVNKFSDNKNFNKVLVEVIMGLDNSQIDSAISVLDTLNEDVALRIDTIWAYLLRRRQPKSQNKQEFSSADAILLRHIRSTLKQGLVTRICSEIRNFEQFNGVDYWNSLSQLEQFISEHCADCELDIRELDVAPEIFVAYVEQAKEKAVRYKLKTSPSDLEKYIIDLLPDNINSELIRLLSCANYEFPNIVSEIDKFVESKDVRFNNFYHIVETYKQLSDVQPIKVLTDVLDATSVYNDYLEDNTKTGEWSNGYFDIVAIMLSFNQDVADITSETIDGVSKVILKYVDNIQVLIESSLSYPNYNLNNKIIQYLINNKITSDIRASKLVQRYGELKSVLDLDDDVLLNYLSKNNCETLSECITSDNIQSIVAIADASIIYSATAKVNNELSLHINTIALEMLNTQPETTIYQQLAQQCSGYWFIVASNLVNSSLFNNESTIIVEYVKRILLEVASGVIIPNAINELTQLLIDKLKPSYISSSIDDIIDNICNNTSNYTISPQKFMYFESKFRTLGKLKVRSDDAVPRIIKPVFNDNTCKDLILENMTFYADIVNSSKNSADFKRDIENILGSSSQPQLIDFANLIGISNEQSKDSK